MFQSAPFHLKAIASLGAAGCLAAPLTAAPIVFDIDAAVDPLPGPDTGVAVLTVDGITEPSGAATDSGIDLVVTAVGGNLTDPSGDAGVGVVGSGAGLGNGEFLELSFDAFVLLESITFDDISSPVSLTIIDDAGIDGLLGTADDVLILATTSISAGATLPAGLSFDGPSEVLTFSPKIALAADDVIRIGGTDSNGGPDEFVVSLTVIPEPASLALLGLGGMAMFVPRRRR